MAISAILEKYFFKYDYHDVVTHLPCFQLSGGHLYFFVHFSCLLWKTFSWLTLYFYDSIALPKKQHCFGYVQVSPESDFSVVAVSGQPREWRVCDQWPRPLLRSKNDVTESPSRGLSVMPMSVVLKSRYFQIQWRHVRYFLGFIIRRHPTQKKKELCTTNTLYLTSTLSSA